MELSQTPFFLSVPEWQIRELAEVDSTQSELERLLAKQQAFDGLVLLAKYQTQGKGQLNAPWVGDYGQNLYVSFVLETGLKAERQFVLNKLICLRVLQALHDWNKEVVIKWPNDFYLNGKKIGGILIQNSIQSGKMQNTLVGIGINLRQSCFPEGMLAGNLISSTVLPEPLALCLRILDYFEQINGRYLWPDRIHQEYLNNLLHYGDVIRFSDGQAEFEAKVNGIDEWGRLELLHPNGELMRYGVKELTWKLR